MTDSTRYPRSASEEDKNRGGAESPPRMPRWVKVAGMIVGVLILAFVVLKVTGVGGEHGPGRHMSGAGTPVSTLVAEQALSAAGHS